MLALLKKNCIFSFKKILTTFDLQIACLSVMRVIFEVHWTREHEGKPENQRNIELVKTN